LFLKEASIDIGYLIEVLKRHGLEDAWQRLNK
jgi:hypothetical protein